MLKFVFVAALVAGASAGYASSQYAGTGTSSGLYNQVNTGNAYADKYPYTNTGYNGGFTSNYAGLNGVGAAAGAGAFVPGFAPFQPVPAIPNAFDYNSFFQGLQTNFAKAAATQAFATAGATAGASASLFGHYNPVGTRNPVHPQQVPLFGQSQQYLQPPQHSQGFSSGSAYSLINHNNDYNNYYNPHNLYQQQLAYQNALFNSIRHQQAAFSGAGAGVGAGSGSYGGAPGYAGASASYGPGGFHQTAQIYPENPNVPNIDTRFGGSSEQGKPGFVGVSSFSSSSNINGQSQREAVTTVNDNGKVTSYHVRS